MKERSRKKSEIIEEDEINLIDIIKVLWRWRYFILGFFIVAMAIVLVYVVTIPVYYESRSIIELAKFDLSIPESAARIKIRVGNINSYLDSSKCLNECIRSIGKKELYKILEIDFSKKNKELYNEALGKLRDAVSFKGNSLFVKLQNPTNAIKLNNILAKLVVKRENRILNEKLKKYEQQINKIIADKKTISSFPFFEESYVSFTADENPVRKVDNRKKIVMIAFFVSIFLAIFLAFILEFFRNLDWKQITSRR